MHVPRIGKVYFYTVNISTFDISSACCGCGAVSLKPDDSLFQCLYDEKGWSTRLYPCYLFHDVLKYSKTCLQDTQGTK